MVKKWKVEFSIRRNFSEDESYIETWKKTNKDSTSTSLEIFLGDCGGPIPSPMSEDISEFCENLDPQSLLLEQNHDEARSWLHDSEFNDNGNPNGVSRRYARRLTYKELHALLKNRV